MKIFFFGIFLAICVTAQAQELPHVEGRVQYEVIDSSILKSKEILFDKASSWVVSNFSSAREVIQLEDKAAGKLVVKGNGTVPSSIPFSFFEKVEFTISFSFKDNKYRLQIFDISGWPSGISSIKQAIEPVYAKFVNNDYTIKGKKGKEVFDEAQKEKDRSTLKDVNEYFHKLATTIKLEMQKNDDW